MALHRLERAFAAVVVVLAAAGCGGERAHDVSSKDEDGGRSTQNGGKSKAKDAGSTDASGGSDADAAGRDAGPDRHGGDPGRVIAEPEDDAQWVFDQKHVRTYNIEIDPTDLAKIDADPAAETYANAKLEVDGEAIGPVAVRYKGSVGAFYTPCTAATGPGQTTGPKVGKCSMKIDFDRIDPKLRFYGLKKLNLHSLGRDASLMRERLGYAMFREFGIVAPRAMHARVLINGELEGLFIAVEQLDGRFTHSRFSDGGDGNLYKEVWPLTDTPDAYRMALETNEGADTPVDKMIAFKRAIDRGAAESFKWIDARYMFDYIAADRLIINDDGAFHWYCTRNHNYYWYEAERADRVWLIPWDLDGAFEGGTERVHMTTPWNAVAACFCAGFQQPAQCDRLTSQWASRDAEYQRSVDDFIAGPFAEDNINAKLATWTEQVDAMVQDASGLHGAPTYVQWQDGFATLQAVIQRSRAHRGYPYDDPPDPKPDPDVDAGQ
jgi:hypothetical protein